MPVGSSDWTTFGVALTGGIVVETPARSGCPWYIGQSVPAAGGADGPGATDTDAPDEVEDCGAGDVATGPLDVASPPLLEQPASSRAAHSTAGAGRI